MLNILIGLLFWCHHDRLPVLVDFFTEIGEAIVYAGFSEVIYVIEWLDLFSGLDEVSHLWGQHLVQMLDCL